MRIQPAITNEIEHKWEADEYKIVYKFCYEVMEYAYKEVEFWEMPDNAWESFSLYAKDNIRQIETHIITSYVQLFKYSAHDSLIYWEPIAIHELFEHVYWQIMDSEVFSAIKKITQGKIQRDMSHLNEFERLLVIYCRSIIHYGLFVHNYNIGYRDWEFQERRFKYNRLYYYKVLRDIKLNYDNYSDIPKNKSTETPKINFKNEIARKQVIIYFTTLNKLIIDGMFLEDEMFKMFIKCIETGTIEESYEYELNSFYSKKLLVNLIEVAKDLFKNYKQYGQFYYFKNTRQFKYLSTIITGTNWQVENLNSNPEELDLFNIATKSFEKIKRLAPFEIDDIYNTNCTLL